MAKVVLGVGISNNGTIELCNFFSLITEISKGKRPKHMPINTLQWVFIVSVQPFPLQCAVSLHSLHTMDLRVFPIFVAAIICLLPATVDAETNYLVAAQNAAMAVKTNALYWAYYYRDQLSIAGDFVGTAHLDLLIDYLQDHGSDGDGAGMHAQYCTDIHSNVAWNLIREGDTKLEAITGTAIELHQSVYSKVRNTNAMTVDWNIFYDNHTEYINQVNDQLEGLLDDIGYHMLRMFFETIYIMLDLYDCLFVEVTPANVKNNSI